MFPYDNNKTYGIFVKEQIESLNKFCNNDVYFINAKIFGFLEYLRSIREIRALVKDYDLIHCHHQFAGISYLFSFSFFNKKSILSILGDIKQRNFINKFCFYASYRFFDKVIFKNEIPFGNSSFVLLPNGVNPDFFKIIPQFEARAKLNLSNDLIYVLFVSNGSLDNPIKRIDLFKGVVNLLNSSSKQYKFMPLFLSGVERDLVPYYYNASNFMILSSDHEGSPNAVKEAMATNLPVISTSVGDVHFLLNGVSNSYLSNENTIESLYSLCLKLSYFNRSNGRDCIFLKGLDINTSSYLLFNQYKSCLNE